MPRRILLVLVFVLAVVSLVACSGPEVSDAALCRDYVHRLCIPDICPAVTPIFTPGTDCETDLLARSGCSSDAFAFTTPDRATFLNCRLPLLHAGDNVEQHPDCDDITDSFTNCPAVEQMFSEDGGTP